MSSYMRLLMFLTGLFFMMYFSLEPIMDMFEEPVIVRSEDIIFINNSGCFLRGRRSPARYSQALEPINLLRCPEPQLMSAMTKDNANFLVPKEMSENLHCKYWVLAAWDFTSSKGLLEGHFSLKRGENSDIQIGIGRQIVRVKCKDNLNFTKYHDVHFFVPPPLEGLKSKPNGIKKLSVMVLGIDSISHMHFVRNFPHLNGFLESMHTKFFGYSRVGLDTRANLVPFLSGFSTDEADSTEAWLWEIFKAGGYTTAFGEDSAEGVFPSGNGKEQFPSNPTDFYLPPVLLEMHSHSRYSLDLREMVYCTAERQFQGILRDFIAKLVPHMQQRPFFSFFWQSQGVQEYYEFAEQLDQPYMMLLKSLQEADVLNNTIVFLMSDHGLRAGDYRSSFQGMAEESQPFLLAIYPDWLKDKYPQAMGNFESNSHSLITPYDLHQTLKDVVRLDNLQGSQLEKRAKILQSHSPESLPRGISLFLPIPEHRTCELAHIPPLFCFCRKHTEIPTDDGLVLRCSRFLVESINQKTKSHPQCAKLKLQSVVLAYFMELGEESFSHEFRLRVKTLPGNGEFETTVRVSETLVLTSPISRVNRYQKQSHCVSQPQIKALCFCT
ncbi:uncharacterized protein LOC110185065 [Drosophila serrata]|uniref:uncharacterized protein LOC110185065 n=1 Tax=Drosophila serrata TaxID=7274 RepID=UPI000A1D1CF0|nr:uncharacterized protein LOC110185065 [Drosophila serrata]